MTPKEHASTVRDAQELASCNAVALFFRSKSLPYPRSGDWRLPGDNIPLYGCINGLPNSQGALRVTNGILAYIERADGSLLLGHLAWWEGVDDEGDFVQSANPKPNKKRQRIMREYA